MMPLRAAHVLEHRMRLRMGIEYFACGRLMSPAVFLDDGAPREDRIRLSHVLQVCPLCLTCCEGACATRIGSGWSVEWAATPLGKILMIAVDQIVHLAFLWAPAWLSTRW